MSDNFGDGSQPSDFPGGPPSGAQPGQVPPAQPGQMPPAQPGQMPPAQPGQMPPAQPGQALPGQMPPAQPGQMPPPQGGVVPYGEENKKIVAGITALLVGGFGVHKFLLGYTNEGIIQLVATFVTCGLAGIIPVVEGIIYLTKSDQEFYQTYQIGRKPWF